MLRRSLLLALVVTTCLGVLAPVAPATASPALEPTDCWYDLPEGVVEGETIDCYYAPVPLEHDRPEAGTIRLAVAVVRSTAALPEPDPLVFLTGGPGNPSTAFAPLLLGLAPDVGPLAVRASRDVVFVDQRGTGYSQPQLRCPEVAEFEDEFEALRACHARLSAETDLSAFDTENNAADLAVVRDLLGAEQVNLFGVSYGSKLVLNALRGADWVRSAVIDSPAPALPNYLASNPRSFQSALNTLERECAADPDCAAAHGPLGDEVDAAVLRLNETPAEVPVPGTTESVTLTGDDYAAALEQLLFEEDAIPLLPQLIDEVAAGNYDTLVRLLLAEGEGGDQPTDPEVPDTSDAEGLRLSILCAEEAAYRTPAQMLALSRGLSPAAQALARSLVTEWERCAAWPVEPAAPGFQVPVVSDVPTLAVVGIFDPVTPPRFGRIATATLSDSQLVVARNASHAVIQALGACGESLLLSWVEQPGRPVDEHCTQEPLDLSPDGEAPTADAEVTAMDGVSPSDLLQN